MKTRHHHVRRSALNQLEISTWKAGAMYLTNRVTAKEEITAEVAAGFNRNLQRYGIRVAACGVGRLSRVK